MDTFLQELKSRRAADLNGVLVTLNDGSLCRAAQSYWIRKEWIVVAPHSPLLALPGAAFTRDITLAEFCGSPPEESTGEAETGANDLDETDGHEAKPKPAPREDATRDDDDS